MSQPMRHHYIPIFYLKQWAGVDGRLCEYSRPFNKVKPKRKHPAGTGYVNGLYTIPGLPPEDAQFVEKEFMQLNDHWAADALHVFLNSNPTERDISAKQKVGWARFIYSLIVRTPEHITRVQEQAKTFLKEQAIEVSISAQALLPELINSKRVITEMAMMRFRTATVRPTKHSFLTSDRPIIMTNGLQQEDAHIVIPISPRKLFMAAKGDALFKWIESIGDDQIVAITNARIAEQAIKYVYGVDDTQLRFVANRLGKMVKSTPLG